ncbi:MAG: SDR family oxidoreductase [Flavobacteriales bacterium]|jgi:3-oxoacyl-[acyl-carrier protein] reductase|nr:SDR family oxidoreductase [Crocinitomicaceae bacterium]NBX79243.1 SDR family oxidoreductase [Flavobacteriales bacterium]
MNHSLINKTALVCGSTQGIGKATALKLAKMGANLVLIARDEKKLKNTISELDNSQGQKHSYLVADFSQPNELKTIISDFVDSGNKINILINNTGGPKGGPIIDAAPEEFINTFNQHLICNHILVQALYKGMIESGYGRIINVISTSVKQPLPGLGVSNTIRGAVASWSKTLANELGQYGITVNNVLPGATNTIRLQSIAEVKSEKTGESVNAIFDEMAMESPMKRIAQPEEIAAAIAFLASPEASYINGINVPVDGGRTKSL